MKRKVTLSALLLVLLVTLGCAGELIFIKDAKLAKIKDDGTDLTGITPQPAPTTGNFYHNPDVNHQGERVAFVAGTDPIYALGSLWTMKTDGSAARQINLTGSSSFTVKWLPGNEPTIAYYGKDLANDFGICIVSADLASPSNGKRICDTNVMDHGGFDLNKPQAGPLQIIFSHYIPGSSKLYRRAVETVPTCAGSPQMINPYLPPGVPDNSMHERLPAISFAQSILASAVDWPGMVGIRLRGIDQSGSIGVPLTVQFQGLERITEIAFAQKDEKIYFSAKTTAGDSELYSVSVAEILRGISDLFNLPPAPTLPVLQVTPSRIQAGPGRNLSPSGINKP